MSWVSWNPFSEGAVSNKPTCKQKIAQSCASYLMVCICLNDLCDFLSVRGCPYSWRLLLRDGNNRYNGDQEHFIQASSLNKPNWSKFQINASSPSATNSSTSSHPGKFPHSIELFCRCFRDFCRKRKLGENGTFFLFASNLCISVLDSL